MDTKEENSNEVVKSQHSDLFPYEKDLFLETHENNSLSVFAEGFGIERIIVKYLQLYCEMGNKVLVVILNSNSFEQNYYIEQLIQMKTTNLPKVISGESTANQRKTMYTEGGVYFASSRIFVMDFLVDRIPIHLITAVIVTKAHFLTDAYLEPFILRLFRSKNKTAKIHAFTDQPVRMSKGMTPLAKLMKNLFVANVFLRPRFHLNVKNFLEEHGVEDTVEVLVPMTREMREVQKNIFEIKAACFRELKENNRGMDQEDWTVENSLGREFDRYIRKQLDPQWNQLSFKTKQLVSDMRKFTVLLQFLCQYDCTTFLWALESQIGTKQFVNRNCGWVFMKEYEKLFECAKRRVFGRNSSKTTDVEKLKLEVCPKWIALMELMEEIKTSVVETKQNENGRVLIFCNGIKSMYMICDVLQYGHEQAQKIMFHKTYGSRNKIASFRQASTEEEGDVRCEGEDEIITEAVKVGASNYQPVETFVHTLYGNNDYYQIKRILAQIEPRYIILYDANIRVVREIEIYKASRPNLPFRLNFMQYDKSVESQVYMTSIKDENRAFDKLIQEKNDMVVHKGQEGMLIGTKYEEEFLRDDPLYESKLRYKKEEKQVIVVDAREFRSELPTLIHSQNIEIQPVQLEVGDYILTPDICVERKSIPDLIGSLCNGRLYSQCTSMTRSYKKAILLIEFDAKKAFSFKARGVSNRMSLKELNQRLVLLIKHFPALRIAWCSSPKQAAVLFKDIKINRENPDSVKAEEVRGVDDVMEGKYNFAPQDFLMHIPGIDKNNARMIMKKVKNLLELTKMSENELSDLLQSKINGKKLFDFFRLKVKETNANDSSTSSSNQPKARKRPLFSSLKASTSKKNKIS